MSGLIAVLALFTGGLLPLSTVARSAPLRDVPAGSATQPLARSAFLATMDAQFHKMDANGDGFVSDVELAAQQQRDVNDAAVERARTAFARLDANHDGQVTSEEFVRASVGQQRKVDVTALMGRLDVNRDHKVSVVEYRTLTLAKFDQLDADKDGIVSPAEQRAAGLAK